MYLNLMILQLYMTIVYITCKDNKEAKAISKHLLDKRLIACANIHPIDSLYRWQGKLQEDKEVVIIAKTQEKHFKAIKQSVKKLHSYDIPCILKLNAEANEEYTKWIKKET